MGSSSSSTCLNMACQQNECVHACPHSECCDVFLLSPFFPSSFCFYQKSKHFRSDFKVFVFHLHNFTAFPPQQNSPRIVFFTKFFLLYSALFIDAREYCARVIRGLTHTPYRTPAYGLPPRDICRQLSNRPRSINVRMIGCAI